MSTQRKELSFKGQKIYVGIDVHKSIWSVTTLMETGVPRTHPQKASAKELFEFLNRHYPEAEYLAAYEAGFTGFSTYYALREYGIDCVVVNAAVIPTTQYESVMKSDPIDSVKIAKALRAGQLRGIYVREADNLNDRSVVRIRKTIQIELSRYRTRVKHMLHSNGVEIPERFNRPGHWSKAYLRWLREDVRLMSPSRVSLDILLYNLDTQMKYRYTATGKSLDISGKKLNAVKIPFSKFELERYVVIGGKKWATMNLGATTVAGDPATCFGDYYAWGETEPRYTGLTITKLSYGSVKITFDGWKSDHSEGYSKNDYPSYKLSSLDASHDAATKAMGSEWHTPSSDDFLALYAACGGVGDYIPKDDITAGTTATKAKGIYWCEDFSGVKGVLFSDGTNRLFFPSAGSINGTSYANGSHSGLNRANIVRVNNGLPRHIRLRQRQRTENQCVVVVNILYCLDFLP